MRRQAPSCYDSGAYHREVVRVDVDGGMSPVPHLPGWPRRCTVILACGHTLGVDVMGYRDDRHLRETMAAEAKYCMACAYEAVSGGSAAVR